MKKCTKCKTNKETNCFPKCSRNNDGLDRYCKICRNSHSKIYRNNIKEEFSKRRKKYYAANREKMLKEKKKWYSLNKDKKSEYDIHYRKKNKIKIAAHKKNWINKNKNNPEFKIKRNLRRRIHHCIVDGYKSDHTMNLLGCSIKFFMDHLESKFTTGMSWDNYGEKWHIDHIRPCSSFNLLDSEEQKKCFHYLNCQPLWKEDNLKKGRSIII